VTSPLVQRARDAGQSRRLSLLEAILNTLIGFWISVLANLFLLPIWGFKVSLLQSIEIGIAFTLVSILRSYLLRRAFNYFHVSRKGS
jgi:hypothetical protein